MNKNSVLVIDDEANIRGMLNDILKEEGYNILLASNWGEAKKILLSEKIDVVMLDINMPGKTGMEILEILKDEYPAIEVVMMSGQGTIEVAVKSTKMGAVNFIEKPLTIDKTLESIELALSIIAEKRKNTEKKTENTINKNTVEIIGKSGAMNTIREKIEHASKSDARVLILGDNGTGKESIARMIHIKSDRSDKPFVDINCAAIPENLIESELFGYEKGAFTGAVGTKKGKFEVANQGTIFLDEVADMSQATQAKMLRVLQEMEFERVGGNKKIKVNVRVIAATNKDIVQEMKEGNFREDLFYRLNVVPIIVPKLRERKEDIPLLTDYYLDIFANRIGEEKKTISKDAMNLLMEAEWRGNIRELVNIIERLNVMVTNKKITRDDVYRCTTEDYIGNGDNNTQKGIPIVDTDNKSLKEAKSEFEKLYIIEKLKENDMNVTQTANALKMERSHLHKKIKQYNISTDKND